MRKLRLVTVLSVALALLGSVPANAGGPITSGSTVAGSVAGPTFLETWTFSGTSGNRVVITAVATSGAMTTTIVLKAPGGSTETSTTADRLEWQLLATGTYTIQIEDTGLNDAGTYALCFMNITAGPLTSPSDLNGGPIVSADVKTGTVGAADIDGFSFTGTNGNRVLIDGVATAGSLNTVIYLYPPGGGTFATWTGGGDRLDFQLTATGTWTILIEDSGNDTPGDYSMSLAERHRRPADQRQRHGRRRHRLQRDQDGAVPAGRGLRRVHVHGNHRQSRRHGRRFNRSRLAQHADLALPAGRRRRSNVEHGRSSRGAASGQRNIHGRDRGLRE